MMTEAQKKCVELIEKQQKACKENTAPWVCGEQLKAIVKGEPDAAELVSKDLELPKMSIADCEKKIKAWADAHKTGNFSFCPPHVAESIIREFYGLAARAETEEASETEAPDVLDLADFL